MTGSLRELAGVATPVSDEKDAYEQLLTEAIEGEQTQFARQDYVEEAWRIVDPFLKTATPVCEYEAGTWGPREVDHKVAPAGGWSDPKVSD